MIRHFWLLLLPMAACDGVLGVAPTDEEVAQALACAKSVESWCLDSDGDGFGTTEGTHPPPSICSSEQKGALSSDDLTDAICYPPKDQGQECGEGETKRYVNNCSDCNDGDGSIHPGADDCETAPDNIDNDCDELTDNQPQQQDCYVDEDGDKNYISATRCSSDCVSELPDDAISDEADCNDGDSTIFHGAIESACADSIDSDCDGTTECAVAGSVNLAARSKEVASVNSVAFRGVDIDSDGVSDIVATVGNKVYTLRGALDTGGAGKLSGLTVAESATVLSDVDESGWVAEVDGYQSVAVVSDPSESASSSPLYLLGTDGDFDAIDTTWTGGGRAGVSIAVGDSMVAVVYLDCNTTDTEARWMLALLSIDGGGSAFPWLSSHSESYSFEISEGDSGSSEPCATGPEGLSPFPIISYASMQDATVRDDLVIRWSDYEGVVDTTTETDTGDVTTEEDRLQSAAIAVVFSTSTLSESDDAKFNAIACKADLSDLGGGFGGGVVAAPSSSSRSVDYIAVTGFKSDRNVVSFYEGSSDSECPAAVVDLSISAPESGDSAFGATLAGAGDVNGDGFQDLLVGSVGEAFVYLADGSGGYRLEPYATIIGDSSTATFPFDVFGGADLNGDGFSEFGVLVDGTLYLFAGGPP